VRPGDVVLVRFPFADTASTKKRPALVLSAVARGRRHRLATVAMITSQVEALRLDGDVNLAGWHKAGLLHPSLLRLAKVATVDGDLVDKTIGRLAAEDQRAVRGAFRELFASWLGD
jgi:mRNA interferase MazF